MNKASGVAALAISPRLKMMVALMSDIPEMVSVPRELLEIIEKSWRVPHGCPVAVYEDVNDIIRAGLEDLRTLLAAPAEDVSAVVDEPVAWADPDSPWRMCTAEHKAYAIEKGGAPASALITLTVPLYRQAQREKVMPERMTMRPFQTVDRGSTNYKAGWNAYDDEFTRLNP